MSLEKIIEILTQLNLSRIEAEIFIILAKTGAKSIKDLYKSLHYSRKQIYFGLESLTRQSLLIEKAGTFSVVPFEEAIELLIEQSKQRTKNISRHKCTRYSQSATD